MRFNQNVRLGPVYYNRGCGYVLIKAHLFQAKKTTKQAVHQLKILADRTFLQNRTFFQFTIYRSRVTVLFQTNILIKQTNDCVYR